MLISHSKLNVKSEDEVIDAIILWLSHTQVRYEDKELIELMKQPNWPYVSFEKMVEIFKTFPIMRTNIHIKGIFHNEMKLRATKSNVILLTSVLEQNEVSQPPRASYNSVMIETIFDYKYFLDKVSDYIFRVIDQQSVLAPQSSHNILVSSF